LTLFKRLYVSIEIEIDTATGGDFLKCEYNRDGDSYRSPWTNKYYPHANDESIFPSAELL
jgi:capping protein (actin filament) muscle Z-line, beta